MTGEMITFSVLVLLAVVATPTFAVFTVSAALSKSGPIIIRLASAPAIFAGLPSDIQAFIAEHKLRETDVLRFGEIPFAVYRMIEDVQPERYFTVMASRGKFFCDICSDFSDEQSLTTTRSANAFVQPRPPESFIQGFPNIPLAVLWSRHLEAELFLLEHRRVTLGRLEPDLAKRLEHGLRRQGALLKATPLFWLKAPYWFWVKRFLMVNKTIAQQLEADVAGLRRM